MAASSEARQCCIFEGGRRCALPASATSLSKRAKRFLTSAKQQYQISDRVEHNFMCLHHKDLIALLVPSDRSSAKRPRKPGEETEPMVNFSHLHMTTLKRYKRHYKLPQDASSKTDLVEAVSSHFYSQDVVEYETLVLFTQTIKNSLNKFDQKGANGYSS